VFSLITIKIHHSEEQQQQESSNRTQARIAQ